MSQKGNIDRLRLVLISIRKEIKLFLGLVLMFYCFGEDIRALVFLMVVEARHLCFIHFCHQELFENAEAFQGNSLINYYSVEISRNDWNI